MEDDWQKIADEDVKPAAPRPAAAINKWDGEDEDDDIKDSWDADDDDEKKDEEKAAPASSKPKKTLAQKIEEKERLKREKEEKRLKEKEEEDMAHMTPEERAAEKLRLKKIQEEADLKIGLESLGLTANNTSSLESFNPSTKEEFIEYAEAVSKTVSQFKSQAEYVTFVDELVRNLCAGLPSVGIRKVKTTVDNLYLEKQKLEKGDKPKKKPAGKAKVSMKMERDEDYNSRVGAYEADDYEDFM